MVNQNESLSEQTHQSRPTKINHGHHKATRVLFCFCPFYLLSLVNRINNMQSNRKGKQTLAAEPHTDQSKRLEAVGSGNGSMENNIK